MLFHLTTDDHICAISEQDAGDTEGGSTFASEQELGTLATEWPMKGLVAIWNHLPGVQAVTRFTNRGFGKEEHGLLDSGCQIREHENLAHARPANVPELR